MATCTHPDGCTQAAVHDTRRCLEHAEPVTTHGATAHTFYGGAYDHARIPVTTAPRQQPEPEPVTVPARPYDDEQNAPDHCGPRCRAPEPCLQPEHQPGPLLLATDVQLDPADMQRWYEEWKAALLRPVRPVGFDAPPARGWLARAIDRLFG